MGGHIQKTDGGRWRIDYRDGQGRRHRATFDTRKEADKALTEIKTRIGKGEYLASKLIPTFREVAEDWFRSKSDRRPGTVGNWRAQLDLYLLPKLGSLRLDRIDVGVNENLRDELRAKIEREKRECRIDHDCGNLQASGSAQARHRQPRDGCRARVYGRR